MPRIDPRDGVVCHFVDGQNQIVSRAWSAFTSNPIFMKRQSIRALTPDQLVHDIDRTIALFELKVKHDLFSESLYWVFDFHQIFHMIGQIMRNDDVDSNRHYYELTDLEHKALVGLVEQGGKAFVRGIKTQDDLQLEYVSSKVTFYEKEDLNDFINHMPEGLCRVVQCDFEMFGAPSSVMLSLVPMKIVEGLHQWYLEKFDNETIRGWHPVGESKLQVLIADGSEISRRSIQEALQEFSLEVVMARNGEEAIHIIEKNPADLIFCDMNMPRVNGINFAKWVRSQNNLQKTPLIFCGQIPNKEILLEAVRAGMNEFLVKPPESDKIKNLVVKYLPEAVN